MLVRTLGLLIALGSLLSCNGAASGFGGAGGGATGGGGSGATGGSGGGSAGGGSGGGTPTQALSPFIVVDQFGYRPVSEKLAVIRNPQNPQTGSDNGTHFTPGTSYALVSAATGQPVAWHSGATDASSGDKAWRFDSRA
jgi:hypothetical protein